MIETFHNQEEYFKNHDNFCYDCSFAPERASLGSFTTGKLEEELKSLVWATPDDIYGSGKSYLFKGDASPYDVSQGYLGNCYFLAAAAALAEKVEVIKDLFEENSVSTTGFYNIDMFIEGQRTPIVVDEYIPVYEWNKQPAFSSSKDAGEIWIMLLEKAYSKMTGSYERIVGGTGYEALIALSGAPAQRYRHNQYVGTLSKVLYPYA